VRRGLLNGVLRRLLGPQYGKQRIPHSKYGGSVVCEKGGLSQMIESAVEGGREQRMGVALQLSPWRIGAGEAIGVNPQFRWAIP
jgi:hypothetical protein